MFNSVILLLKSKPHFYNNGENAQNTVGETALLSLCLFLLEIPVTLRKKGYLYYFIDIN